MLLATRCPFCETVFRVLPAHLAARRGLVRCGHCHETFDASGSLFEVPDNGDFSRAVPVAANVAAILTTRANAHSAASTDTAAPADKPGGEPPADADTPHGEPNFSNRAWNPWEPPADGHVAEDLRYSGEHLPQPARTPGITPTFVHRDEPGVDPETQSGAAPEAGISPRDPIEPHFTEPSLSANNVHIDDPEPVLRSGPAAPAPEPEAPPMSAGFRPISSDDNGAAPFAVTREAPARAPRRIGLRIVGGVIAIALLALLGAQLAWWLRESVIVYWPGSQRLYAEACSHLGCNVLPPRDIDGLQVEPSDLRQVDDPHHLELKVPLRNHFNVALAYPAIELTLLDRQNNVVVRRVLRPQDYVRPGMPIDAGLPPRSTETMIVRLDTGNVVASNFRIEIFYP